MNRLPDLLPELRKWAPTAERLARWIPYQLAERIQRAGNTATQLLAAPFVPLGLGQIVYSVVEKDAGAFFRSGVLIVLGVNLAGVLKMRRRAAQATTILREFAIPLEGAKVRELELASILDDLGVPHVDRPTIEMVGEAGVLPLMLWDGEPLARIFVTQFAEGGRISGCHTCFVADGGTSYIFLQPDVDLEEAGLGRFILAHEIGHSSDVATANDRVCARLSGSTLVLNCCLVLALSPNAELSCLFVAASCWFWWFIHDMCEHSRKIVVRELIADLFAVAFSSSATLRIVASELEKGEYCIFRQPSILSPEDDALRISRLREYVSAKLEDPEGFVQQFEAEQGALERINPLRWTLALGLAPLLVLFTIFAGSKMVVIRWTWLIVLFALIVALAVTTTRRRIIILRGLTAFIGIKFERRHFGNGPLA